MQDYLLYTWGYVDRLLIVGYGVYNAVSLFEHNLYATKAIQCTIVLLIFIKLNYYLRVFEGMGFLIQLVTVVFSDLRVFLVYFVFFNACLAIFLSIVVNLNGESAGMGPIGYFVLAFRTSVGDFEFNSFA